MGQIWKHESKLEWLQARVGYLTASQIIALWPTTAAGRPRNVTRDNYRAAVYDSLELDQGAITTTGAMARGHILEPYAIKEYQRRTDVKEIYHWDDVVIHMDGIVAFSPDALNIPQGDGPPLRYIHDITQPITEVTEIKSYGAKKHIETAAAGMAAEERKQIATQMYVCEEATVGRLLLYNPRLEQRALLVTEWTREELSQEIEMVGEIAHLFGLTMCDVKAGGYQRLGMSEAEIIAELRSLDQLEGM